VIHHFLRNISGRTVATAR